MAKQLDSISKTTTPAQPAASTPAPAATTPATPAVQPAAAATPPTDTKNPDSYENLFPEPSVVIENPPQWVWWILLAIGSIVLGLIAFKLVSSHLDNSSTVVTITPTPSPSASTKSVATASPTASPSPSTTTSPTPSPTATPTPAASSTPTAAVKKSSVTLRVLNGSTIAGAAATAKDTLEKAGFTVRTTGNAVHQNYQSTIIYYQTGQLAAATSIAESLASYKPTLQESSLANPDNVLVVVASK